MLLFASMLNVALFRAAKHHKNLKCALIEKWLNLTMAHPGKA